MNKKSLLVGVVAFCMMLSTNVFSQNAKVITSKEYSQRESCKRDGDDCCKAIPEITEAQKMKIKDLKFELLKKNMNLDNMIREKEARLISVTTGDKIDKNAAFVLLEEISALKLSKEKEMLENQLQIRNILNEKQKVAFDQHCIMNMKQKNGACCGSSKQSCGVQQHGQKKEYQNYKTSPKQEIKK